MSRLLKLILVLVFLGSMSGVGAMAQTPQAPVQPTPQVATPVSGAEAMNYRLGSGDKLRITTYGEAALTGEFFVSAAGIVSLPLIGDVDARNLTVAEFRSKAEAMLRNGFLLNPSVSVEVLTYRPFYMLGEVSKPGEYAYTSGLTVMNAVATAGGFSYRANTRQVYIRHQNESTEREYPMAPQTVIQPGDTVRVKERFF
jgi:polysaccharide export outer membrane protein